ncbi:uncharacterized protein LOC107264080 [Cephus cinctus]|uniref:Uncharacterized protein LOC107264080 n=1 Tax=Cephus cinctus TaxID=211228 RepID=A0AAJ7R9X7_CEPCN|nr:uncharacterized protein LOC107264080 [Cephus cinctus]XP_024937059.1 uncharacterized protein LOC107264080 [Cephus cinctus]XP_024937060.1 uncharacterized protein LOC107264080 [Cephus cinctus]
MTSMLPEEDGNAARVKQKSQDQKILNDTATRDESRSFLSFSRENLSISHSDIEQGFNKPRFRPRRHTILGVTAILIALVCLGLEIWKVRRVLESARDVEILKRDVESLKHRLLEEDLLNELKAFEEEINAEEGNEEDDDSGEADIDNADYDSSYDDEFPGSHDYSSDYHASGYSTRSSEFSQATKADKDTAGSDKDLKEMLEALHKVEAKRGPEFEKNVRENNKNIERERLLEEEREHKRRNNEKPDDSHTKHKRSIPSEPPVGFSNSGVPIYSSGYFSSIRNSSRDTVAPRLMLYDTLMHHTTEKSRNRALIHHEMLTASNRHPPKKYYAQRRRATAHVSPPSRRGSSSQNENERMTDISDGSDRGVDNGRTSRRRDEAPQSLMVQEQKASRAFTPTAVKPARHGLTRRHLRAPRPVYAAHYGADSTLFSSEDEHTGNGRVRHGSGVFKAWQSSNWVNDLGMTKHFSLGSDGYLTVHEAGLYLVYGQIHYLDEHDENGFHMLVNGVPVLQCMVYSPGVGHKSRSCFSAQVTYLQANDRLVIKEVGPARYTLFQRDKSFFGLVKLGEMRPQQKQQQQQ